jgi:uncharacterized cupredoxin-like copper-binding protein
MWHVAPWRHAGAQPRAERKAGKELAEECEAFLQGSLAAQLSLNRQPVPSWAWLNQVAHSGHREVARMASDARRHRQLGRRHAAWRWAVAELAAELLYLADARPEEIWRLQKEALVPLELDLASTRQPASPKAVLKGARAALHQACHRPGREEATPVEGPRRAARRAAGPSMRAQRARQGWARLAEPIMYALVFSGVVATGLAFVNSGASGAEPLYIYYRSRVSSIGSSSMQNLQAFRWMTGGADAPGWERGRDLPTFLLPWTAHDPGSYVGTFFSGAPGPLTTKSMAEREAAQVPRGSLVRRLSNMARFPGRSVHVVMAALPDDRFEAAGMVDPVIVVSAGATVRISLLNEDATSAHGVAVTPMGASSCWEPMAQAQPSFKGAALWFLGDMTAGRVHEGTLKFRASVPGAYQYVDPVPGHAQAGMAGDFVVEAAHGLAHR